MKKDTNIPDEMLVELECYEVDDYRWYIHTSAGKVIGQIDMTKEGIFTASIFNASSIGTYLLHSQALDALKNYLQGSD